jgi:hypothetical protein
LQGTRVHGFTSWDVSSDGVRLATDPAFWESAIGERLALVVDDWAEGQLVEIEGANARTALVLKPELWHRLESPSNDRDDEYRALFDRLVPTHQSCWEVSFRSFVGAPRLEVELRRDGVLVAAGATTAVNEPVPVLLTPEGYGLQRMIAAWNAQPVHSLAAQYELVAGLRDARERCNRRGESVLLDPHLDGFEVVRPTCVRLGWEPSARRTELFDLRARVSEGGEEAEPLELGDLDDERPVIRRGKRAVLLDDETARALRHVRGRQQSRSRRDVQPLIHDPAAALPEGCAPDAIDLSEYSRRVVGFEQVVRATRPQDIQSSGIQWYENDGVRQHAPFLELDVTSAASGVPVRVRFDSPEEVERASDSLSRELERERPTPLRVGGAEVVPTVPLRDHLVIALGLYGQGRPPAAAAEKPVVAPPRLTAVIDEEAKLPSDEAERHLRAVPWSQLEVLLKPAIALKEHQRAGLAWLWYHASRGCPGVLLADDMGLGKTLQALCLLALASRDQHPPRPSLVVAPVVLLENWLAELQQFFQPETLGEIMVLHGDALKSCRVGDGLDLGRLREAGLVITNYETLARFQISLLKIDWNVVVLDESHNIKNPDALRTRAACGLKRKFAMAMTGTPVENKLLDLWSLFFFLSPQDPFGSRQDFTSRACGPFGGAAFVQQELEYPSWRSRVLRRTKDQVLELPQKRIKTHEIAMTFEQVGLERSIARLDAIPFKKLDLLRKLYAHPLLLRSGEDDERAWSLESAVSLSPKLARCLDLLDEIRGRGQKALVFSLFINMQAVLLRSLGTRFGVSRDRVINGDTNQSGRTKRILEDFSRSSGFDVLILSPLAAGVGLNIVAANHVIHYDRWWNPAKEDQATDRAYRIGQEREVNVHYLLLHHPDDGNAGFDKRLHELVEGKRGLAHDFLCPTDAAELRSADLARLFHGALP